MLDKKRAYTDQQKQFLAHMSDPSNGGDIRTCMTKAGYAHNTPIGQTVNSLRDELVSIAKDLMASHSIKATLSLFGVLQDPNMLGAGNVIKAAKEILDRSGTIAQEQNLNVKVGEGLVILPAKNAKVELNDDMASET